MSAARPITRREGYARAAGKEQAGIDLVRAFMAAHDHPELASISEAEENYLHGDLRGPSGATLEVKRQPIDPQRYRQNFVEVFEVTQNLRHRDGFARLASLLGVSAHDLAALRYRDQRVNPPVMSELGVQPFVSVSIQSMTSASFTAYANPAEHGTAHLYVYGRRELLQAVRLSMPRTLRRGAGMSNEDTFAVFVPLPVHRWYRQPGAPWRYGGTGDESTAHARLAAVLGRAAA